MSIRNFDLNLLRVFDALMQDRNVSVAAARVALSQPAMSNALARLRAACGDPLFVRTSTGMKPTPFATGLAAPVQQALSMIATGLEQGNRFDAATSTRQFKLVLSDIGEAVFLPPLLSYIAREAPGVRVSVLQLPHSELGPAMESGVVELAIGSLPSPSKGYFQQRLLVDSYVCAMRIGHPAAHKRLTLAGYSKMKHVVPRPPAYRAGMVERALADSRIERDVQLEVPHFLVLPMILESTDLVATITGYLVRSALPPDRFVVKPLPFKVPYVEVRQFWHGRFHHDAGVRWLRGIFASHFSPGAASAVAAGEDNPLFSQPI